jgi:hypothetical protein
MPPAYALIAGAYLSRADTMSYITPTGRVVVQRVSAAATPKHRFYSLPQCP